MPDPLLKIWLLGPLRVSSAAPPPAAELPVGTDKPAALLAYLALFSDRTHRREELAELLRPGAEVPTANALASLRVELFRLRRRLGGLAAALGLPPDTPSRILVIEGGSVGLRPGAVTTDVREFEQSAREEARENPGETLDQKVTRWRNALSLYQKSGALLPDVDIAPERLASERERLAESHARTTETLATLLRETGDFLGALRLSEDALRADPGRGRLRRLARDLHREAGTPAEVLPALLRDVEEEEETARALWERWHPRGEGLLFLPVLRVVVQEALDRLPNEEQRAAFYRCAFFEGDFTAAQAAAVAGVSRGVLQSLQEARLLTRKDAPYDEVPGKRGGPSPPRFRMLCAIRQIGLSRLSSAERRRMGQRLASHLVKLLNRIEDAERSGEVAANERRLRELPHARQALDWALGPGGDLATGIRLLMYLRHLFGGSVGVSDPSEWRQWTGRVVEELEARTAGKDEPLIRPMLRRVAYGVAANAARLAGDAAAASRYAARWREERGDCGVDDCTPDQHAVDEAHEWYEHLLADAFAAYHRGNLDHALHLCDEGLTSAAGAGLRSYPIYRGFVLDLKGDVHLAQGDPDGAERCYAAASQAYSVEDRPRERRTSALRLSALWHYRGDYARARRFANEALRLTPESGNEGEWADCLRRLAALHAEQGFAEEALSCLRQCRPLYAAVRQEGSLAAVAGIEGDIALWGGDPGRAEALYRAGLEFWEKDGHQGWRETFLLRLGLAAHHAGRPRKALLLARQAWAVRQGTRPPLRRGAPLCLLGRALGGTGAFAESKAALEESVTVSEQAKYPLGVCRSLEALAEVCARCGETASAAAHLARAQALRAQMGAPLPLVEARRFRELDLFPNGFPDGPPVRPAIVEPHRG